MRVRIVGAGLVVVAGCAGARSSVNVPTAAEETVRYCASTVTHHDVHSCIYELPGDSWRRRGMSYRLTYRGKHLVRFETINGYGDYADLDDEECVRAEYEYENDRLVDVRCFDRAGVYRRGTRFQGKWARWMDAWGRPRHRSEDRVSGLLRTFDRTGRVVAYRFVDDEGKPVPDSHGVYEIRVRMADDGMVIARSHHGRDGGAVLGADAYHRMACDSYALGACKSERYFGITGQPVVDAYGAHRAVYRYDDVANILAGEYYGTDGKRSRMRRGEAGYRHVRDAHGLVTEVSYLDERGKLTNNTSGYAREKRQRDARGREILTSFFDASLVPVAPKDGHAQTSTRYDSLGRPNKYEFFGTNGQRVPNWDGCASVAIERDARGNESRRSCFDTLDEPALSSRGYFALSMRYDRYDQLVEETFLGVDGQPGNAQLGYARHVIERAKDGSIAKQKYFDYQNAVVIVHAYSMVALLYVSAGETPDPDARTRTREEAESLVKKLVELVKRGNTLEGAALRLNLPVKKLRIAARVVHPVFAALKVGEVSEQVDSGRAFVVSRRDE